MPIDFCTKADVLDLPSYCGHLHVLPFASVKTCYFHVLVRCQACIGRSLLNESDNISVVHAYGTDGVGGGLQHNGEKINK